MPLRNSLRAVEDPGDLSLLDELVLDKRLGQRSAAKKTAATATLNSSASATA